jgi:hypothetical protein
MLPHGNVRNQNGGTACGASQNGAEPTVRTAVCELPSAPRRGNVSQCVEAGRAEIHQRGSRHRPPAPCIRAALPYFIDMMKLTRVQDHAIQALMAGIVGAETFDHVFAGIRFDEIEGTMLYAFARNEDVASDIEDSYSPLIAAVASRVLSKQVDVVVVMPKVLQ